MSNLMIKDLEENKELDTHAMQAIRGGQTNLTAFNAQFLAAEAKGGIAGIATAVQTLVGVNTLLNLNVSPETNINVGGIS